MNAPFRRRRFTVLRFLFDHRANLVDQANGACSSILLYSGHWIAGSFSVIALLALSVAGEHRLRWAEFL